MPPKRKTKVGAGAGAPQLQLRVPGTPQRVTSPASESESKLESAATASGTCTICALPIVDASETNEGQAALFCEGDCQCWYHSWCAGVSRQRYQSLAESTEPFLCPACTSQQQQRTILELQGSVQALASEMLELRAAVAALQNASNHDNTETTITAAGGNEPPWNTVVSRGNRGKKRNETVCSGGGGAQRDIISKVSSLQNHSVQPARGATSKASQGRQPNTSSCANPQRKFVLIQDARRVWGTLRSTTTSAVTNAIKRLLVR